MIDRAIFALGCFWGIEAYFSHLPGVISTRVGYAGGAKLDPTYYDLGDHSEAVEIIFDSDIISYPELLRHFWRQHDPVERQKRQYRSAIFYVNNEQKFLAERSLLAEGKKYKKEILTIIAPSKEFYPAEEYHQKYFEKTAQIRK